MINQRSLILAMTLATVLICATVPNQIQAQESDDGYSYPPGATEEQKKQIDKQEQKMWEDAGYPGANPYCDKVPDDYQGTCHDRYDTDEETGKATCNDMTHRDDPKDCPDVSESNDNDNNNNNDDLPECVNGVQQRCVISDLGLICSGPETDLSNPSIAGGGHACQDIWSGIYGEDNTRNRLNKDTTDGTISMETCKKTATDHGIIMQFDIKLYYRCGNTYAFTFEDACAQNLDFASCEKIVTTNIEKSLTSENTSTLKTCKDGTSARSCGSIGYINNDNNNPNIAELTKCSDGTQKANWRDCDYRADGSYPCSDGTYEVDLKTCNIAARLKNNNS